MMIICFSIGIIYIYTMKNVDVIYEQYARESILDIKKSFLKDNVNNVILNIEQKQAEESEHYKQLTENSSKILEEYYQVSPKIFIDLCIKYFEFKDNKDVFSVLILDKTSNQIVYDRNSFNINNNIDYSEKIRLMKNNLSSYFKGSYGEYDVFWGVSKDYIDTKVKKQISDEIHNSKYSNDGYIWVNEISNYDGGDNYAIRRIHPNLIDTEGMSLSTNMTDIKGDYPYLTELEGVKKDGEITYKYYFKKNKSDVISEKLTYAKLYKKYNWIIAMGVHLDDVQAYVDITSKESEQIILKMITHIVLWILGIFILGLIFLTVLEKWYYKNSNKKLKEEIYIDPLTKVYNRRAGISSISLAFKNFKKTNLSPAIILIDIDDFKRVNDTYGHDQGDTVLINVTKMLNKHIRSTDILCRWGGEEFLLICDGLKVDNVVSFTDKLLDTVAQIEYECNEHKYHVSISMGVSYFGNSDKDYNSTIKRADLALYYAKKHGKNQACMQILTGA